MRAGLATHAPPQIVKTAAYLRRDAPSGEEEEQSLEMDTLKFLTASIPDWQRRLEDFDEQIDQRQKDLARLNEVQDAEASGSGTKSLRPKGSTESLKARDDGDAHPREVARDVTPMDVDDDDPEKKAAAAAGAAAARFDTSAQRPADPQTQQQPQVQQQQSDTQQAPLNPADSHAQRQANAARAAGQARARATLKKRQRTDSLLSQPRDEDYKPKYRSRSMIIVYYDSYVQIFFEELVKFVSSARNMMRKAKMAAKVAKIRRQAELDATDADGSKKLNAASNNNADNNNPTTANATTPGDAPIEPAENLNDPAAILPVLAFRSTRRMSPSAAALLNAARSGRPLYGQATQAVAALDLQNDEPTVWDELDKGLEYVQSMSEHAAHQFLRDGECAEEVSSIKRRLEEVLELAQREMERMEKEEANGNKQEGANGEDDLTRARSYRLQSMRKSVLGKDKDSIPLPPLPAPILPETHGVPPAAKPTQPEDEGVEA